MWLVTGPFDSGAAKTKLLKTGRKVPLGRRDRPLSVNNKKISRDHCEFTVGPCTPGDVPNPSFVPTLEIYNAKEKPMSIDREGQAIVVNPSSSSTLKSGDRINIVVGISVEVHWRRVACFLPPARSLPSISSEDCAALGISLTSSPSALVTHHLTPKYELTVPLTTSLLSATQLVKVEWLQELIRLGTSSEDNLPFKLAPLEQSFSLPSESKYRPIFSPSLEPSLKSFKFWEPNEERLHLLKGYRFVLLSDEEGQVDGDTRELVIRGEGEYECFPLTSGEAKWRQMLAKAKRKVDEVGLKVAIIVRENVLRTVGTDKWVEMSAEAQSLSLPLVNVDTLMNVVINSDVSLIHVGCSGQEKMAESESPLPDFVPNTLPNEPSPPVAAKKAPSEQNDVREKSLSPPPMLFGLPIPPPPSKNLVRRAKPLSTESLGGEPVASNVKDEVHTENFGYTLPPLSAMNRSTKLKRRTHDPIRSVEEYERGEEPPLKKFKALFDASDPDKNTVETNSLRDVHDAAMGDVVASSEGGGSLTQSDTRPPRSQMITSAQKLDVVAEEEEESVHSQGVPALPRPDLLQEARENVDRTESSRTSDTAQLNETKSKPAQCLQVDDAFLTALASRKRRKVAEDEFDREFNNLRIAKPDIHHEEEQAWEILGDFDTDTKSLRGNFMVVIDLEIFRGDPGNLDTVKTIRSYDGRPNFKKFRKTQNPFSRAPVELVARSEHDYGVGSGYWRDDNTSNDNEALTATQIPSTQKRRVPTVLESDDAETSIPVVETTKREARKASQKASVAAERLFLGSEEDEEVPAVDKKGTRNLPTRASKRRHIVVDDDSDDGVTFKGFGKKKKVR